MKPFLRFSHNRENHVKLLSGGLRSGPQLAFSWGHGYALIDFWRRPGSMWSWSLRRRGRRLQLTRTG